MTWDPSIFNGSSNTTVSLKYVTEKSGDGGVARWSQTVSSGIGTVEVTMEQDWLENQPQNNLSVWIQTIAPDGNRTNLAGPVISLIEPPTPSASPSASDAPATPAPHDSANKTKMEVGIPIGLVFLFAFSVGLFLVMRRRRRGYMGSRARGHGAGPLTGDEFRSTRSRGYSFKDEPVQGVELQSRGGHRREVSLGDQMGSPPIDSRREGSNAFREEIARQRAGDHRPRR